MNWGTKLVIGMLSFMTFIVVLGVLMFNSKTDALVDNDYYEKGLSYNADYNRKEQVKTDNAGPQISVDRQNITLSFKTEASGIINLRRNSDKSMDQRIALQTDEKNLATIPLKGIAKGQWHIIVSWISDGKSYLDEQEIHIP
jgi:hypothetical protein